MSINKKFEKLIESIKEEAENIGFYLSGCSIASDSPEKIREAEEDGSDIIALLQNEEVSFAMFMEFDIGDRAFSDEVLNPEKVKTDKEFQMIVPDDYEIFKKTKLDSLDDFDF